MHRSLQPVNSRELGPGLNSISSLTWYNNTGPDADKQVGWDKELMSSYDRRGTKTVRNETYDVFLSMGHPARSREEKKRQWQSFPLRPRVELGQAV